MKGDGQPGQSEERRVRKGGRGGRRKAGSAKSRPGATGRLTKEMEFDDASVPRCTATNGQVRVQLQLRILTLNWWPVGLRQVTQPPKKRKFVYECATLLSQYSNSNLFVVRCTL